MSFYANALPLCRVPDLDEAPNEAQLWGDGAEFRIIQLPAGAVGVQHEMDTGVLDINFNHALTHVRSHAAPFVSIRRAPSKPIPVEDVQRAYLSGRLSFEMLRYGLYISRTRYSGGEIMPLLLPNGRGRLLLAIKEQLEAEEGPASPSWTRLLCGLNDGELRDLSSAEQARRRLRRAVGLQWVSAGISTVFILWSLWLLVRFTVLHPDMSRAQALLVIVPWALLTTVLVNVVPKQLNRWVLRRGGQVPIQGARSEPFWPTGKRRRP